MAWFGVDCLTRRARRGSGLLLSAVRRIAVDY